MVKKLWIALIVLSSATGYAQKASHTFELGDSTFLLDGKPFVMISGELHYPRIPKEAWRDRMKMAKAMGLNTIGTYVFWNLHEPEKGKYNFTGNNDIAHFVKIAQEEGLWVVLRPSPYVCAEWEFGGYPYWLQNEEGLVVRSLEPKFLNAYKNYIVQVAKQLAPLQVNHGGNVLMVQVENEYGFYSNDKQYLETNRKLFVDAGFDGLLYTCDPAAKVKDGHIPGLLPAVNGVLKPKEVKSLVRMYHNGKGPFYVAEWYPAWFDWWGTKHHTVPAEQYTPKLDSLLAAGISVNMYMFHGGTTRDFMNGANYNDENPYEPQISSYDYDAPLDEAGNPTDKFVQFRNVIAKHLSSDVKLSQIPSSKHSASIGEISFSESASLFDVLGKPIKNNTPLTFEDLKHPYGYVVYRTTTTGGKSAYLKVNELRDYGVIYVNGKKVGTLDRRLYQDSLKVTLPKGKVTIDILMENMGRINFGPYLLKNKKGITKEVRFDNRVLTGWEMYPVNLDDVSKIKMTTKSVSGVSVFRRSTFQVKEPVDTYLDLRNWGKGSVWINGHHLGRFWSIGPQQSVYVPAEWLKAGNNELVIFDLIEGDQRVVPTLDKPILGQLTKQPTP